MKVPIKRKKYALILYVFLLTGCYRAGVVGSGLVSRIDIFVNSSDTTRTLFELKKSESEKDKNANSLKTRFALRNISLVKAYLTENGLPADHLYNKVYDNKDSLTWILTATPKDRLEFVQWWFPVVGHVPYIGFSSAKKANKYKDILIDKGYEVSVRRADAYSTLGWFDDPITHTIIETNYLNQVSIVIHEIIHTFYWKKDDIQYNESLAHAVSLFETMRYYSSNFAPSSYLDTSRQLLSYQLSKDQISLYELAEKSLEVEIQRADIYSGLYSSLSKLYSDKSKKNTENFNKEKKKLCEIANNKLTELYEEKLNSKYTLKCNNAKILENYLYLKDFNKILVSYKEALKLTEGNIGNTIKMLYSLSSG